MKRDLEVYDLEYLGQIHLHLCRLKSRPEGSSLKVLGRYWLSFVLHDPDRRRFVSVVQMQALPDEVLDKTVTIKHQPFLVVLLVYM